MAKVIVDGQEVEIEDGERLNGIQVARRVGAEIPHYCWHPGLSVVASCRMCLVETGRRDEKGDIAMVPKLVPACQTPATDGTVFITNSDKVKEARAMVEEDLLIRHPIDCPICDKAGECYLQDYHFEHGRSERRADLKPFTSRRRSLGDTVTLFVDRCVMCSRCVRFTREITETSELMVVNRGSHEEIDVFPGFPLDNKMSGNVIDLCPVGALGDKDFLYSQRVWFMKSQEGVCAGCSTGCSISVEQNQDKIYRLKPRENPHVNQWWMCDEGRYGFKHVHSARRMLQPRRLLDPRPVLQSRQTGENGHENVEWSPLIVELDGSLRRSKRLAAVLSPFLTVEEAYLLAKYIRSIDPAALLSLGPIPITGSDVTYPNGFTIRAEKCPNRRGVEAVISRLADEPLTWDQLCSRVVEENIDGLWVSGGYKTDWIDEATAESFSSVPLLIMQDLFASPLWNIATYQLPGASFAERDGSYVNIADRLQSFRWSVRPPAGVMPEGALYWRLAGREGLYNARSVLNEVAREIGYFAAATDDIPDVGVDLKVNQLAGAS
jgi:NADH-quinone oxidoreductase subunit G